MEFALRPILSVLAASAMLFGSLAIAHAANVREPLQKIDHIVVIYQENHSFDNL
jgi:phospholipase C